MSKKVINELYVAIGKRVRDIRERNNLSQEKMAEILCIATTAHYQNIEYGRARLTLEQMDIIKNKFGVSSDYLLCGEISNDVDKEYDFFSKDSSEQMIIFFELMRKSFNIHKKEFEERISKYLEYLQQGDED